MPVIILCDGLVIDRLVDIHGIISVHNSVLYSDAAGYLAVSPLKLSSRKHHL